RNKMDKDTLGELYLELQELEPYLKYFEFTNIYGGSGFVTVTVSESKHSTDIESYDYDAIYKKIDEINNRIKNIIIRSQLKG
ncbi:hypothetical protein, partial [Lactococcus lactis]